MLAKSTLEAINIKKQNFYLTHYTRTGRYYRIIWEFISTIFTNGGTTVLFTTACSQAINNKPRKNKKTGTVEKIRDCSFWPYTRPILTWAHQHPRSSSLWNMFNCKCWSLNSRGFDSSGIWGAADKAMLNKVLLKNQKKSMFRYCKGIDKIKIKTDKLLSTFSLRKKAQKLSQHYATRPAWLRRTTGGHKKFRDHFKIHVPLLDRYRAGYLRESWYFYLQIKQKDCNRGKKVWLGGDGYT